MISCRSPELDPVEARRGLFAFDAGHLMKCPGCGDLSDMRDLNRALAHLHDADIEISEGERHHAAVERRQTKTGDRAAPQGAKA